MIGNIREETGIGLSFLGNAASKIASIASYTYGTLLIFDSYAPSKEEQAKANDAISLIIMISNILVVPLSLFNGYLLDHYKSWQVLIGNCLLVIISLLIMILTGSTFT